MKNILVPLDGSARSEDVVSHVEQLLAQEPCETLLVHVVPRFTGRELPGQVDLERTAAQEQLDEVKARLERAGATVSTLVSEGDAGEELLALIRERAPTLVAMSSHGRSGVARWVLGSVAERVARDSPAPVLLVTAQATSRGTAAHYRRILVPLDGTEQSAAALPIVEKIARRHGAEALLARVEWEGLSRPLLAATLQPEKVAETLRPWQERLEKAGVTTRVTAVQGSAASEIVNLAEREDVDLIAMATHGRHGLSRLLDGSVAEHVLRHCRRPLLVVHT